MASMTNEFENTLLNFLFGGASYTPPATWYLALYTAAPTESGGGTECAGSGYARVALSNNTGTFPTTSSSLKVLGSTVQFPEAANNWGSIVAVGLFTVSTGGTPQLYCLITSQTVVQGDTFKIPSGPAGLSLVMD